MQNGVKTATEAPSVLHTYSPGILPLDEETTETPNTMQAVARTTTVVAWSARSRIVIADLLLLLTLSVPDLVPFIVVNLAGFFLVCGLFWGARNRNKVASLTMKMDFRTVFHILWRIAGIIAVSLGIGFFVINSPARSTVALGIVSTVLGSLMVYTSYKYFVAKRI